MSMAGYQERLKSTVVTVAREILVSDGLSGLQARRIARGADCSVGTIYNLFGNLDMVIINANAKSLSDLHADLLRAKEETDSLDTKLSSLAQTYLRFAVERTNEWRAVFEHRLTTKTEVPDWYREDQAELFAVVEDILQPVISGQEQRQEAARALFSAVHGVVALALDEKLGPFDKASAERQVQFIIGSLARGLAGSQR